MTRGNVSFLYIWLRTHLVYGNKRYELYAITFRLGSGPPTTQTRLGTRGTLVSIERGKSKRRKVPSEYESRIRNNAFLFCSLHIVASQWFLFHGVFFLFFLCTFASTSSIPRISWFPLCRRGSVHSEMGNSISLYSFINWENLETCRSHYCNSKGKYGRGVTL